MDWNALIITANFSAGASASCVLLIRKALELCRQVTARKKFRDIAESYISLHNDTYISYSGPLNKAKHALLHLMHLFSHINSLALRHEVNRLARVHEVKV